MEPEMPDDAPLNGVLTIYFWNEEPDPEDTSWWDDECYDPREPPTEEP